MNIRQVLLRVGLVLLLLVAQSGVSLAYDPTCSPPSQGSDRWYAVFFGPTVGPSVTAGAHARIQKTQIILNSGAYQAIYVHWILFPSSPQSSWAEIGYGFNPTQSGEGGPLWYYYYRRGNGTFGYYQPLNFNAQADDTAHDVTIKWVSSGGTYKGYIDNIEAMFASGLSDTGLSYPEAGLESMSCHTQMWSNTYDSLTTQSWSTLQWSYWTSGSRGTPSAPALSVWIRTPASNGSVNPSFQVAEVP